MCANYTRINSCERFVDNKEKWDICRQALTSSTQLQNRSFHVVEKNENGCQMYKDENCTCKSTVFSLLNMKIFNGLVAVVCVVA